ncbi:MAG: MmgE/PrpD family protein [Acidobacteria bacterium RIFCSPLOWO2_12_FULL_67_14]|nr:MAG: MmgE/PrpD family protein [Acidobacteria bacterium RIFCSPLOWO2_02_FULL_67_21]OFW39519.1 MAG: MmgE/PrpD family protein [Acidobacteria bacterium RIFCSPLOWO2_12_FULL_67_14]
MTLPFSMRISRRELLYRGALAAGSTVLLPLRLRAQAVGPIMVTLSDYMAAARDRALPPDVVEKAKHHILDTFAAMVSGSELPPGRVALALAQAQAGAARAVATVVGSNIVAGATDAALVNGVLAHSDETDDSHGASQSHPGASIVPAAFALGEQLGITGQHFLRAVTLGYDVGPRVTIALGGSVFREESRRSTHAFAGTFGASTSAGCVAALTAPQMRWLLDYASQQASGYAVWGRDTDHIEKGFVFGGMPARNGVTAALLVRAGWNGVDDVFSGADNFFQVNAPKADPKLLVEQLGERYEVTRTDIKKWTVGTPIQAPLDAIENLRRQRPFEADDVKSVIVRLAPSVGFVVDNRDIPDICLQHMVAVMLIDKTASFHAAHDKPRMQDAAVLRQRRKVTYVPDEGLVKFLPARVARVEVTLNDGTQLSDQVEAVRGTVRNPMTRDEVVDKARDLVGPVLGPATAQKLIEAMLALETMKDVRTLRPLLQKA